jgi:hypothetical protein
MLCTSPHRWQSKAEAGIRRGRLPSLESTAGTKRKSSEFFVADCNRLLYPLPKYWEKPLNFSKLRRYEATKDWRSERFDLSDSRGNSARRRLREPTSQVAALRHMGK